MKRPNQPWLFLIKLLLISLLAFSWCTEPTAEEANWMERSPSARTLGELFGVNGYWGWGYNQYSRFNPPDSGQALFAPYVSHFRLYHDMTWDLPDPDTPIDFSQMANTGTPAKAWVNWDLEYPEWTKYGKPLQISLQMANFPADSWDEPYQSAYNYGFAYARHFGTTHGQGWVKTVEIGNEPWNYPPELYRQILDGMSAGVSAGDPAIEIYPCALQVNHSYFDRKPHFMNYLPTRLTPDLAGRMAGLNVHSYAWDSYDFSTHRTVMPEQAGGTFLEMYAMLDWRDKHLPDKKIYLSEFGYESAGGGNACPHRECLSPELAAAYAVRSLVLAHRLGFDRATWFYYADEEREGTFSRSGLVSSRSAGFREKPVFTALKTLLQHLGDRQICWTLSADQGLHAYAYGTTNEQPDALIAWYATETMDQTKSWTVPEGAWRVAPISIYSAEAASSTVVVEGGHSLEVGAMPMILLAQ